MFNYLSKPHGHLVSSLVILEHSNSKNSDSHQVRGKTSRVKIKESGFNSPMP